MRTLVIGVAGGTGSGKTTVARKIAAGVPPEAVAHIEFDSYYRDRADLSFEERCRLNFDHPDSLETSLLIEHVRALKRGEAVDVPNYDFTEHARRPERQRIAPSPLVIVEGILTFVNAELRELFDLRIFVDTDADIRVFRRIRRDMEQRGRDFESIREQYYSTVRPMHLQFVEPSKQWAHIVIPEGGENSIALDLVISKARSVLSG